MALPQNYCNYSVYESKNQNRNQSKRKYRDTDGAIIFERLSILWNGNILINVYNYMVLRNLLDNGFSTLFKSNLVVQVDGWFTENIEPSRGIRQGCPLSALLFILGIEVLGNKLRKEQNIKGIFIRKDDTEMKVTQLADDMTLFVQDVKSGENAIYVVEEFEKISGVQ